MNYWFEWMGQGGKFMVKDEVNESNTRLMINYLQSKLVFDSNAEFEFHKLAEGRAKCDNYFVGTQMGKDILY